MSDSIASFLNSIVDTKEPAPRVYSKTVLSNETKKKLLSYQEHHVVRLITILLAQYVALDNSDCGTGKTYISAAICRELGRRPIIICPKSLLYIWLCVLSFFGVKAYDIVNYETFRNGRTYTNDKFKTRKKSPFIDVIDADPDNPLKSIYEWKLPKDAIVIFDEAHRCKDSSTDNGKLLASAKQAIQNKIPVLMLTATICEKIADMKIPFYLFSFIPNTRNFNHYAKTLLIKYPKFRIKKSQYTNANDYKTARENAQSLMIFEEIKGFTSRIRIKDLGDKFPTNQICCQQFVAEESDKIACACGEISKLMDKLKNNPGKNDLAKIQKLKQEIEFRKVPIFIEQANLYLEDNKSVIIFVNYLDTLHFLSQELTIRCQIFGNQTMEERQNAIDLFQSNQERIIICQIRAGGVGIGLHDLHGDHPRVTLLNFPDSAADLLQALGRAPRANAKSPVLQRIIFVANVDYEKRIMQLINRKLANISAINDGDLGSYQYKVKRITRRVVDKKKKSMDEDDDNF